VFSCLSDLSRQPPDTSPYGHGCSNSRLRRCCIAPAMREFRAAGRPGWILGQFYIERRWRRQPIVDWPPQRRPCKVARLWLKTDGGGTAHVGKRRRPFFRPACPPFGWGVKNETPFFLAGDLVSSAQVIRADPNDTRLRGVSENGTGFVWHGVIFRARRWDAAGCGKAKGPKSPPRRQDGDAEIWAGECGIGAPAAPIFSGERAISTSYQPVDNVLLFRGLHRC
jgi:hypothetical protein